jgi:hypothetical protein
MNKKFGFIALNIIMFYCLVILKSLIYMSFDGSNHSTVYVMAGVLFLVWISVSLLAKFDWKKAVLVGLLIIALHFVIPYEVANYFTGWTEPLKKFIFRTFIQ